MNLLISSDIWFILCDKIDERLLENFYGNWLMIIRVNIFKNTSLTTLSY